MRHVTTATTCVCCAAAMRTGAPAASRHATQATVEQMPAALETNFALSASPVGMHDHAEVNLLDRRRWDHASRRALRVPRCPVPSEGVIP